MIFAAGLGTRLRPYTDTMPKALVPVAGKPMIWHQIQRLRAAGVEEVVVNVHHFADDLEHYLLGQDFGVKVQISDERGMLLDTGGGLLGARRFFEGGDTPFLIHNVDIFSNLDLRRFIGSGLPDGAVAKLLVSDRDSSRKLLFDNDLRLEGWKNIRTGELRGPVGDPDYRELAFGGVHLVSPRIFSVMDELGFSGAFSIIELYLATCARYSVMGCCESGLELVDVGKADSLEQSLRFLL